jgi:RHS repeat-associated protein
MSGGSLSVIGGKAYWNGTALEYYNSSSAFFEHRDWVGTRRATTNSAATVTNVRTSLPFGDGAANVSGGQDSTFDGYTGLWNGGSSATNHAQFREYWNVAGRWLQPDPYSGSYDPSNPQSFNRYAYALNNPARFVDPLGLTDEDDTDDDACDDDSVVCAAPGNNGGGSGGGGPKDPNNPGNCAPNDPGCASVGGGVAIFDPDFVMTITSTPITATISGIPNDPCYNSALASVGVGPAQLRQRIKTANTQSLVGSGLGTLIGNPVLGALIAYGRLVHTGGPQDDKNLSQNHSVFGPLPNAVAAGNISFGVTCPFGAATCQFAAGLAQTLSGHPDPKGTLSTGFDTPSDNAQIRQGQAMRAAGCHT